MSYSRALAARLQWCRLAGIASTGSPTLPLAALAVERTILPAGSRGLPPLTGTPHSIASLARTPGARALLTAGPAEGKTFALRRLALACAAAAEDPESTEVLQEWPDGPPTPLLLDLSAPTAPAADLPPLILAQLERDGLSAFAPEVLSALRAGVCLVLLDECATAEAARAAAALADAFPGNRFIAAGPPAAAIPGFQPYDIQPLDKAQINAMVAAWCAALAPPGQDSADHVAWLQGRLLLDGALLALASWPLALGLCILADHAGLELPARRAAVYAHLADLLIERGGPLAAQLAAPSLADQGARLDLIAPVALALLDQPDPQGEPAGIPRPTALTLLREALARAGAPGEAAEPLVERLTSSGLLACGDHPGTVTIPRRALRESLAARALAAAPNLAARAAEPRWHAALALAARERERAEPAAALALVRELLEDAPATAPTAAAPSLMAYAVPYRRAETPAPPAARPTWRAPILAAECLRDLTAQHEPVAGEVRRRLIALLGDPTCPLTERIRAGRLLGEIGDPRFDDLAPPLAAVPGGPFLLGARVPGFDDEGPPQRIDVPAFQIGVYPVTNREYARFLAAVPGHPRPHYWFDPRFSNPSLPVVGVTWHDAMAFCDWLTSHLAASGRLPAGAVVRLPLEAEWEKAATWGPGAARKRVFPWGDEWDPARANLAEGRREWLTTPVGCYPGGVSRYGTYDMAGNVWEWTASEYLSYPGARLPFHTASHYVLRGSSCVALPTNARATYRGSHLPPHYWRYHLGFRVVVGRPIS